MLLTAVAGAFRAAGDAVTQNDQFFIATQAARVALNRMLTQVRRGTPADDSTSEHPAPAHRHGHGRELSLHSTTKQLSLVTSTSTILVHDASQCSFGYTMGTDPSGNSCVAKVTVTIGVDASWKQQHSPDGLVFRRGESLTF